MFFYFSASFDEQPEQIQFDSYLCTFDINSFPQQMCGGKCFSTEKSIFSVCQAQQRGWILVISELASATHKCQTNYDWMEKKRERVENRQISLLLLYTFCSENARCKPNSRMCTDWHEEKIKLNKKKHTHTNVCVLLCKMKVLLRIQWQQQKLCVERMNEQKTANQI